MWLRLQDGLELLALEDAVDVDASLVDNMKLLLSFGVILQIDLLDLIVDFSNLRACL